MVSDALSYLPGSPTTGLSGVAGVGDVGVFPVQTGLGPNQTILSNNSTRFSNGLDGSATWQVTPSLDLEGSGNWQILSFTGDNPGNNTNEIGATFGPNYRIDALNSVGAQAFYQRQTYPGYADYLIETEGANVTYSRTWTRRLSTNFAFGPAEDPRHYARSDSRRSGIFGGNASVTYATRTTGFFGNYSRGVNSGSGIIFGALSDTVGAGLTRPINRDWNLAFQVNYSHDVGLAPINNLIPTYNSVTGSAQVGRRLTEIVLCVTPAIVPSRSRPKTSRQAIRKRIRWIESTSFLLASRSLRPRSSTADKEVLMLGHRTLSLDDYLGILKRRWLLILIPAVILPIVSLAITYRLTPIFTSQTLVIIDSPKVPDEYVKPVVETNLDSRLASMKEQILSRSRLEPIIKQYNLGEPKDDMDSRIDKVRKDIDIKPIHSEIAARRRTSRLLHLLQGARSAYRAAGLPPDHLAVPHRKPEGP